MKRKKMIEKMLRVLVLIVIISGLVGIYYVNIYTKERDKKVTRLSKELIGKQTKINQKYLDEIAEKIKTFPVDKTVLSLIQSEFLKKKTHKGTFIWMSNAEGDLMFGLPRQPFIRLNKVFDKKKTIIKSDGYYVDRNDFFSKLVTDHDEFDFNFTTQINSWSKHREWRFYQKYKFNNLSQILTFMISSPVLDENKEMIGNLYLAYDGNYDSDLMDKIDEGYIYSIVFDIFLFLFFGSLVFIWILLPTWVYIDASQKDLKRAFTLSILTAISFGFIFIVYLLIRPSSFEKYQCPECEKEIEEVRPYCPDCGANLSGILCPRCQSGIESSWKFCPNCSFDIENDSIEEK